MIVKLLRQHWKCLGNRWSLRYPSWQFSVLQIMQLLICLGEDKYLLTLLGFSLICLNSAHCHHLKLHNLKLFIWIYVVTKGQAASTLRAQCLHLFMLESHGIPAPHLANMRGGGLTWRPVGAEGVPLPCRVAELQIEAAEHDQAALYRAASST